VPKSGGRREEIHLGTCKTCQAQEDLHYDETGTPRKTYDKIERGFSRHINVVNFNWYEEVQYRQKARQKPPLRRFKA
jgi:hypothetical protein